MTSLFVQNYGAFFDLVGAGITGPVKLSGPNGALNLSSAQWTYQVDLTLLQAQLDQSVVRFTFINDNLIHQIGLRGEDLHLYDPSEASPEWVSSNAYPINQPLIWYKVSMII